MFCIFKNGTAKIKKMPEILKTLNTSGQSIDSFVLTVAVRIFIR